MKRPLERVALFYGGGLLLAEFFPSPVLPLFIVSLTLAAVAISAPPLRRFCLWPLVVLTAWTNLTSRTAVTSPHDLTNQLSPEPRLIKVRGKLEETPARQVFQHDDKESWRSSARLTVTEFQTNALWQTASGRILVTAAGILPAEFFQGREVEIQGVIAPPPPALADGLFNFQAHLRRQDIHFQLKTESSNDWRVLESLPVNAPLADRFRGWAAIQLGRGLPVEDESLGLERALTLGEKTVLTEEVAEPFVRAATYHIFAVDGLRMAILFAIFFTTFRVFGMPRAWCGFLILPLLWFYTALTGWPASAIRATVMLSVVIGGWALKRPGDLLNSLYVAALIILTWDPQQLFQAGFQLSFVVVYSMILILPTFEAWQQRLLADDPLRPASLRPRWRKLLDKPLHWLLDLFFVSLAAWLGSIPLVAQYFHIFTPVSGPANVLAVPLCALVLTCNFLGLLLASWFPAAAELFNHAGWFLMEGIRVSSAWFERWPAAYYYVSAPGLFSTLLYYGLLLGIFTGWLFHPAGRRWKISVVISLSATWIGLTWWNHSAARLTVLPLNGGSAIYVNAPGKAGDLLIDCGNSNSVQFVMKLFLRAQGVNELPALLLTHGDTRHVGGVELLGSLFPLGQVITSPVRFRSAAYRSALQNLRAKQQVVLRGSQWGAWTVLHPAADPPFPEADDNALVLRAEFYGTRLLFLSDLGVPGQMRLLETVPDLRADIVVTCLPEKGEPLGNALLSAIQPRAIIMSDSDFPASKRASLELAERLRTNKATVYFTRESGAVEIIVRKDGWKIQAQTPPEPKP